jgi:hypothetical protein
MLLARWMQLMILSCTSSAEENLAGPMAVNA